MPQPPGSERIVGYILNRIDDVDETAALDRVDRLRVRHPDWLAGKLVEQLIRKMVRQTAAIGAATAGAGVIPVLGTVVALTIGTMADLGATLRLQSELVLEIAAVHGREISKEEKRRAFLLVAGFTAGGGQLVSRGGANLSARLTQRYAQRWVARALPFAGIAAAALTNAMTTYLIGRRAHAYFARGPAAIGSWAESLRALSGVDERRLAGWLRGVLRRPNSTPHHSVRPELLEGRLEPRRSDHPERSRSAQPACS